MNESNDITGLLDELTRAESNLAAVSGNTLQPVDELYKSGAIDFANFQASQEWTPELVQFLSSSILLFGIAIVVVMAILALKGQKADNIMRMCALPLIIVAAVFLVVTGYTNEQIAPVTGLLGAIAGYILGAQRAHPKPDD